MSANSTSLWTSSSNNIFNSNSGNVGIGTTTPMAKFDVNGTIKIANTVGLNPANGMVIYNGTDFLGYHNGWKSMTGGGYTAGSGINIVGNTISTIPQTLSVVGSTLSLSGGGGSVSLPTGGSGGGNWTLTGSDIKNSNTGKILMADAAGTTGAKVEVVHDGAFGKVVSLSNTNASYMTILEVKENGTSGGPAGCVACTGSAAIKTAANFGDAIFATSNSRGMYLKGGSASFYPAMVIENNAGVTTSLDMDGQIQIRGGSPGIGKVLTSDASGLASWTNGSWITNGNHLFANVSAAGNVGIGTNSPSQKLTVNNGTSTGTYTTTGWMHSSDSRLKTNIRPLENALAKIVQLQGVSYNWNAHPTADNQVGFLAQDVEKVFPEVVVKDKAGNYSMAQQNLITPMVEAIKEQQKQLNEKSVEITELKTKLAALEAMMLQLMNKAAVACPPLAGK